jgi:hypothetical protein
LAIDRTIRCLSALSGASTSRVLNLTSTAATNAQNPEFLSAPLFTSPAINRAMLLKHRVRTDENYLFASSKSVATKIIVPFDPNDLRCGGRSFFIDQKDFLETLRDVGHYDGPEIERDLRVLNIINKLPSLDPFLLREHLRANAINCADCYVSISPADQTRMYDYVASEIRKLISLATGGDKNGDFSTSRLVSALLSNRVDEKLEPLRLTLSMAGDDFREGVFSWRGFLYYKWSMEQLWPEIMKVLREIRTLQPRNAIDSDQRTFFDRSQRSIINKVRVAGRAVEGMLKIYDEAYADLVRHQAPKMFRDFLLSAPKLFIELGENMGAISHIVSFWRFRFVASRARIDSEELAIIYQDFASSFSDAHDSDQVAA